MTQLVVSIDEIKGAVKIHVNSNDSRQTLEFQWCAFGEDKTGFIPSFNKNPVFVTPVAAEQFLRILITSLIQQLNISSNDLKITNYLGEELQDVQFLPPTFSGTEADIQQLIMLQDNIRDIYSLYEVSGDLSEDLLMTCRDCGILNDFLSLLQIKASGFMLILKNPNV